MIKPFIQPKTVRCCFALVLLALLVGCGSGTDERRVTQSDLDSYKAEQKRKIDADPNLSPEQRQNQKDWLDGKRPMDNARK